MITRPAERFRAGNFAAAGVRPALRNQWGKWGQWGSRAGTGAFNSAYVNKNFQRSLNWSYRPNCWGGNPWWTSSACHSWYNGCWNYGWNSYWHHHHSWCYPRVWPGYSYYYYSPISWGLACWGLGSAIYDSGYAVYTNPYPPEPYTYGSTVISYEQPMSVAASSYPTGDEEASDLAASRSAEALERSRSAFLREDYLTALKDVDEAISYQPGDSAMHEYRALVLFSLGKYDDAAGVLNPVLASGPGWDLQTMLGLYSNEDIYLTQLAKLKTYVKASPDKAAPRFLLGYHYLVGGQLERARDEFYEVTLLQPSDSIARQLRDLAKNSTRTSEDTNNTVKANPDEMPADAEPPVEAIATKDLVGTWTSNRGENGTVVLNLRDDGNFSWTFTRGEQKNDLAGTYQLDERGLLVLTTDDSQMVGKVKLPAAKKMSFVLEGGPEGDPGISFDQAP